MPNRTVRSRAAIAVAALLVLTLAAACAPAAGRPVVEFVASAEDVIAEIAIYGVSRQPNPNMNFYSVESIGERFVTLYSESTVGFTILIGRMETRLSFTAQQREDVTVLAASGRGTNASNELDIIIMYLSSVFERL